MTICFAKLLWIYYVSNKLTSQFFLSIHHLFHKYTKDSLGISRENYDFTIFCGFKIFNFRLPELTLNSQYFREFTINSLSFSRISFEFSMNSLSVSRIHYEFTLFFGNSLSFWRLFHEFALLALFFANYGDFVYYAKSLWTYFLFRVMRIHRLFVSGIHYDLTVISQNYYKSIIFSQNTMNALSHLRIYYQFTFACFD